MRRQDSNLRPPGYELIKSVFFIAVVELFALFHGKPGGHSPLRTTVSPLCYPRMGQRMGQDISYRQMASFNTIQRQLTIRSNQIKELSLSVGKLQGDSQDPLQKHWSQDRTERSTFSLPWWYRNPDWSRNSAPHKDIPDHLVVCFLQVQQVDTAIHFINLIGLLKSGIYQFSKSVHMFAITPIIRNGISERSESCI